MFANISKFLAVVLPNFQIVGPALIAASVIAAQAPLAAKVKVESRLVLALTVLK